MRGMNSELIVALDLPNEELVDATLRALPEAVRWYKVGLELFCTAGPAVLARLQQRDKRIFLDLKLHDIPNTVAAAVHAAAGHRVDLLTVHATGGAAMLKAAAEAAREHGTERPQIIAVTTLTSLSHRDLKAIGVERDVSEQAIALGRMALDCGIDGLVCSPLELEQLREAFGAEPILVTPGIRLADDQTDDQKRVSTPETAVRLGADYLVVGRSLLNAPDPRATAERMLQAIAG